ncbi:pilus assembly protein CpaB [Sinomonas atrocyanea]|uniref:Flp pilus assembly protein CpaB n=1 Tax=Sinomonas atrocyanea TaxID=37927 RepID=UPI00278B24F4|nr:RcpC/CpaB family pilus assembly protein [Sinomonas atrocyanea]MDP9884831.1 pilus assembly protein CpaB [Sinomonas atrocyanea]
MAALIVAIIGTVLLLTYVNGADRRALADVQTQDVYVVQKSIPAGAAADAVSAAVALKPIPKAAIPADPVTDLTALKGKVTSVALEPGEQLLSSRLVDPAALATPGRAEVPSGMQELTVRLPIERVIGGALAPGDTVGVLLSLPKEDNAPAQTQLAYHKVLVTAVQLSSGANAGEAASGSQQSGSSGGGLNSSTKSSSQPAGDYLVTIARPAADAERIVYAAEFGKVYLTKEPAAAQENTSGVVDRTKVFR